MDLDLLFGALISDLRTAPFLCPKHRSPLRSGINDALSLHCPKDTYGNLLSEIKDLEEIPDGFEVVDESDDDESAKS